MAKKIIYSKPSIRTSEQLKGYRTLETHRRRISRYESTNEGLSIPRKSYIASLLMLKKLKGSRVINP